MNKKMEQKTDYLSELLIWKEKIKKYENNLKKLKEKLNKNKKIEELLKSLELINDNQISLKFFFFQKLIRNICSDANKINSIRKKFSINNKNISNNDIYNIFILWIYFLYSDLIDNIYYNNGNKIDRKKINQINYLLQETFDIIIILYHESNILPISIIFEFLYFFVFLIENNLNIDNQTNNFDELYKIKNNILLKNLLEFFGNISYILLNKANIDYKKYNDMDNIDIEYKTEINLFFDFLKYLEESKEINYRLNKSIILNNNLISNLFEKKIFEKINIRIIEKYENNFENKLINFYANFIKFNYLESNILSNIINSLKNSFCNLYEFNDILYNDIFVQDFYVKLIIKILFSNNEKTSCNNNIYPPLFNSFFFNSNDSIINLKLTNKNFLDNFSLFFSFNLIPKDKNEDLYNLFLIEKNSKDIIFNLSLKYDEKNNIYSFVINNEIISPIENKIIIGMTYYINITFISDKVILSYKNEKDDIKKLERNTTKKLLESDNYNLIFGKKENNTIPFSGYIGPIIIIKNLLNSKNVDIYSLINNVLELKTDYPYFIFLKKELNYFFENLYLFNINNKLSNAKEKFEKFNFECLLYLSPHLIKNLNLESKNLENIDDICLMQKNYEIIKLNVSLVKHGNASVNFVNENGLNYLCLLYEYLYQFLRRMKESRKIMDECVRKNIVSIVENTLCVVEVFFHELEIIKFNKSFKQLFMNMIHCIKLISNFYCIIDDILDSFFIITIIYNSNVLDIKRQKQKNPSKDSDNLLQINCSFLTGFIDFLLSPKLYDEKGIKTLTTLFDKLENYFNENSILINLHFFDKLLDFSPYLINYFESNDIEKSDVKNLDDKNDITKILLSKKYFAILKLFFEKNTKKNENFIYLKYIFNFIDNNIDNNYEICLVLFDFINDLIGNDPDFYFSNDSNEDQIEILLPFIEKFSVNSTGFKQTEKILLINRRKIFNKIIAIYMKIIFTKKRINKTPNIIKEFKNLLLNIDISKDLIETITEEINKIIDRSIGAIKIKTERKESKEKKESKERKESKGQIKSKESKEQNEQNNNYNLISNFYSEIFNLISFFLEYPVNNRNIDNFNDLNIYEENAFTILRTIKMSLNAKIDNNIEFNVDSIFCLIELIKFYSNMFFKRLYDERYIGEFIEACKICMVSGLIHSNILIKIDNCYKTLLEIILDTIINYVIFSSNYYNQKLTTEQMNNIRRENITKEQDLIYDFLREIFPVVKNNYNNKNNSINDKKKQTIFYKNDYLNFLVEKDEKEKNKTSKNEQSLENMKEYPNYKKIYNYLIKVDKFYLNFCTFFLIKLSGYNLLLINSEKDLGQLNSEGKKFFKFNEIAGLINETISIIYEEHKILSENKLFLKLKKKNISELDYYEEVKKRIDNCNKKKKTDEKYKSVNDYIFKHILEDKNVESDFYNFFNSGKCCKKESNNYISPKLNKKKELLPYAQSEKKVNLFTRYLTQNYSQKEIKSDLFSSPNLFNSPNFEEEKNIMNNSLNSSSIPDEDVSDLKFEEETSSNDEEEIIKNSPQFKTSKTAIIRNLKKEKTISSQNKKFYSKISERLGFKKHTQSSFSSNDISNIKNSIKENNNDINNIPYINYFEKPDFYYLKNAKKELMNNIFSIYFFDEFFNNKTFKILKNIFLQNKYGSNLFTKQLKFPSKIKNYSNGLDPFLFLKPFPEIYNRKEFYVTHEYFCKHIKDNNIKLNYKNIFLYKKILPEFNIEKKIDEKCELIKINKNYYGHIILSKTDNFFIFEELNYDFFEQKNNNQNLNFNDLFTLSLISKQQKTKNQIKKIEEIKNKMIFSEKKREKKIIIIIFEEIDEIIEKRFLLMWQAIEIYLKNGKSYFFNFLNNEKCKNILDIFKNNLITKDKIHYRDFLKKEKLITKRWVEERLSTYEYLLYVNKYGTRTFNDTNQYYIFPWLERLNENNKIIRRNLKYQILAQTDNKIEDALTKYSEEEGNHMKFPCHFGPHYSTSAYVYFYLMRVEPFSTLLVKLQGYRQEVADRMFSSIEEILYTLRVVKDCREIIPELFNNCEIYLNLNCVDFGNKKDKELIDDFCLDRKLDINNENKEIYINDSKIRHYVKFVIEKKNFLNNKKISSDINNWIDIIFGVEQLPDKNKRKKSLNIFYKESYEQNLDLQRKLKKLIEKKKDPKEIIEKISNKINLIVSFGQTPHQIFDEHHPKYGKSLKNTEGDFEFDLNKIIWSKEFKIKIDIDPIFFITNQITGKILIIDKERKLEIYDNTLYGQKEEGKYQFIKYGQIKLNHILNKNNSFCDLIIQKYSISSFEDKIELNLDLFNNYSISSKDLNKIEKENNKNNNINENEFNLYYNDYIKKINYEKINKVLNKKKKKEDDIIKIITCQHPDNSFKIYYLNKSNIKKEYKPISYICEDFVSSCCAISSNKFLVGLRNGKLIQYSIEIDDEISKSKKGNTNINNIIKIKFIKQIQAHKGEITLIEINKRLGVIITGGKDNYIFIRKLYDFELLTPIKIKSKYDILLSKISPLNFLYILCFNKKENKSRILGYTLNGLFFSKSPYELFYTLDFTKEGNIVTWMNKTKIRVLYGYKLDFKSGKYDINNKQKLNEFKIKLNKLNGASWVKFDFFSNKNNLEPNSKIITYINIEETNTKNIMIKTLDLSEYNYFD